MKSVTDIENELRPWFRDLPAEHPAVKVLWAAAVRRKAAIEGTPLPATPSGSPKGRAP